MPLERTIMRSESILIAETDQFSLHRLTDALSAHLPRLTIDTCTTVEKLTRRLAGASYDAVAMSPKLAQSYRSLKDTDACHVNAPCIVTVNQKDLPLAYAAFEKNAFDVIVKPIVPPDAARTVRLALWQNRLQKLAALKEQTARQCLSPTAPRDLKAKEDFLRILETTCETLQTSFGLLLNLQPKSSLSEITASLERHTRQLALDRLLTLSHEGRTH